MKLSAFLSWLSLWDLSRACVWGTKGPCHTPVSVLCHQPCVSWSWRYVLQTTSFLDESISWSAFSNFPSHQTLKPQFFSGLLPWIHHPHMVVVVHHCFCRWFSLKMFKCYKVATSIATPKKIAKCFEDVVHDRRWYPPICSIFPSFPSSCIGHALLPCQLAKTWFFERSKNAWKEHPAQITQRAQQPQQWAWQHWKLKSWPPACSASVIPLHQLPLQSLGR